MKTLKYTVIVLVVLSGTILLGFHTGFYLKEEIKIDELSLKTDYSSGVPLEDRQIMNISINSAIEIWNAQGHLFQVDLLSNPDSLNPDLLIKFDTIIIPSKWNLISPLVINTGIVVWVALEAVAQQKPYLVPLALLNINLANTTKTSYLLNEPSEMTESRLFHFTTKPRLFRPIEEERSMHVRQTGEKLSGFLESLEKAYRKKST
jgi:hypothetical protein